MLYFISDLHLEEARPDITGAFFAFLDQIQQDAEALYILGDFFEAWIGDDEHTPLQQAVAARLRSLSKQGAEIFIMHGNRDFLIGDAFCTAAGATLLPDPTVIDIAGRPVLLMHGDSLCTRDESYMKFRRMIREPNFLKTFLARPLEDRKTTAAQLRAMSQANNRQKAEDIMDVTPEEVPRIMAEHGVRTMIHGHTHRPAIHNLQVEGEAAQRIVLGDWDRDIWTLTIDAKGQRELTQLPFPRAPKN